MSFSWPNPKHKRNLTGQAVAKFNCNNSEVLLGVVANITIKILNFNGKDGFIYTNGSTYTSVIGDFATYLPVFETKSGKMMNYDFELTIAPNNNSKILKFVEDLTMNGNEWETTMALGRIIMDEDIVGNQSLPCPA